jgi:hypothetical protein
LQRDVLWELWYTKDERNKSYLKKKYRGICKI